MGKVCGVGGGCSLVGVVVTAAAGSPWVIFIFLGSIVVI
jgi:hypothetical protein